MSAALDQFEDPDYPYGGPDTIQRAWAVMAGGAVRMSRVLINLAENSKSDFVKVQAATAVLDRVGLTGAPDININVLGEANQAEQEGEETKLVLARLEALSAGQIIDAVIVDEDVDMFVEDGPAPDLFD